MAIPTENATTRRVRSEPKMSENAQFWGRMYFPTKYFRPYLKSHFGGPFNTKPIIQIALRKSHVNGATKVKLYSYIGKYLVCVKSLPLGGVRGAQGPFL